MRFGLIGGGNISDTHARAALRAGAQVVAVMGRNRNRLEPFRRDGVSVYDNLGQFLEHPMDAVIVGSPSGLHAEHAIAAARRGLHALVEKPLDISTRRADAVIAECDRAGVKLGVVVQDRTAPDMVWLKQVIEAGLLGAPILASARLRWYRPPEYYATSSWRGTWSLDGGGAVMNQGTHSIDLLLWLMGEVRRVYALTRTAIHKIEVEDTAIACFDFARGAVGTFEAATSAYPGLPRRLELTGMQGTIIVEGDRVLSAELRTETPPRPIVSEDDTSPRSTSATVSDVRGHARVIEDFIAAVKNDRQPLCDGRDARRSIALVQAMYESARRGAPVVVDASAA